MPTRKIADFPRPCRHPDHDPPKHIVLPDGVYEHTCAGCGATQRFEVSRPTLVARVEPPAHPTTLGNVWTGVTKPTIAWLTVTGTTLPT